MWCKKKIFLCNELVIMGVVGGGSTPYHCFRISFLHSFVPYQYQLKIMATEIITQDDLREFKIELLADIKKLLKQNAGNNQKKWLKSYEVRELLNISPGTLQHLRVSGTLPFTKVGGTIYYDFNDIHNMISENKIQL